ncbi:MAG: hypothetical protein OXC00_14375 [Acidimicrobiaceae bacterium]|nr:hypothetical protein [Acidimicrobiaceae bacterium]
MRRRTRAGLIVLMAASVAVLPGCEDGPGATPQAHAIEGTWELAEARLLVRGYVRGEDGGSDSEYDQEHPIPMAEIQVTFTFKAGTFTGAQKNRADDPWVKAGGIYLIDDESDRVMVLLEYQGGYDVSYVYRYKLSGSTGLVLREQIDLAEQGLFPTADPSDPWTIIIEETEVTVRQMERVFILKRV